MMRAAVTCMVGVLALAPQAAAEEAWDQARQHYERGRALETEGDLADALLEYQRAQELRPTFRLHLPQGRVCRGLGRYQEALAHFQTFLRDGGDLIDAGERAEAAAAITDVEGRVSRVEISTAVGATVLIDGRDVGRAPLSEQLVLDPGSHRLEVRLGGHRSVQRDLSLERGQTVTVEVELEPLPASEPTVEPAAARPEAGQPATVEIDRGLGDDQWTPEEAPSSRRRLHRAWFWSVLALSSAALVGGVVFGALALNEQGVFDDLDVPDRTSAQEADLQASRVRGYDYTLGADVLIFGGLGLGLVTLALGFFTDFHGTSGGETPSVAISPSPGGAAFAFTGAF